MQATVIQLSDLHFGAGSANPHPVGDLAKDVAALAIKFVNPIILASGDITYKASQKGYQEATHFFNKLKEYTDLTDDRFLFCPGNHDCHADTQFEDFDAFAYGIRRDKICSFTDGACQTHTVDGLTFVLLNSAHHLDHRFGLVDIEALEKATASLSDPANTVAVSHHHVIPTQKDDPSTTRNAYELLASLDKRGVPLLLHGHQHVTRGLPVGRTPLHVVGVNSFNFAYSGGQNAVGVLEWGGQTVTYSRHIYVKDGYGDSGSRFTRLDKMDIR